MNILQLRDVLITLLVQGYIVQEQSNNGGDVGDGAVQDYILLEDGSLFLVESNGLVGSYTLPNGSTTPAVYVVGQQGVPSDWKVEGLELTIRQFPDLSPKAGIGIVDVLKQWEVILTQYTTTSATMSEAMERIVRRFPDATLRYLPGYDISYERCRVIIPDREIYRLYQLQQP